MAAIKVKIALAIDPSGYWAAYGYPLLGGEAPNEVLDACLEGIKPGETYYWLEAEIPIPSEPESIRADAMIAARGEPNA